MDRAGGVGGFELAHNGCQAGNQEKRARETNKKTGAPEDPGLIISDYEARERAPANLTVYIQEEQHY